MVVIERYEHINGQWCSVLVLEAGEHADQNPHVRLHGPLVLITVGYSDGATVIMNDYALDDPRLGSILSAIRDCPSWRLSDRAGLQS